MIRLLFLSIGFVFISASSFAQDYSSAVGLRAGYGFGVTYKTSIGGDAALEAIGQFRYRGFNGTLLYEKHYSFFDLPYTMWYFGGGGHVGFYQGYDNHPFLDDGERDGSFVAVGLDGILGLEVTLNQVPLNISLDWKPVIQLVGWSGFAPDGGALSIRYVIN